MSESLCKHVDILLNTTKSLSFVCLFVLFHLMKQNKQSKNDLKNPPVACVDLCFVWLFSRYDMISDVITGSGSFQVTVQLMNGTVPLPNNYSLSREEAVVVDVSLNTSSEQIKVVINKCWATPTHNPEDTYSHIFLENRSAPSTISITKVLALQHSVFCHNF